MKKMKDVLCAVLLPIGILALLFFSWFIPWYLDKVKLRDAIKEAGYTSVSTQTACHCDCCNKEMEGLK